MIGFSLTPLCDFLWLILCNQLIDERRIHINTKQFLTFLVLFTLSFFVKHLHHSHNGNSWKFNLLWKINRMQNLKKKCSLLSRLKTFFEKIIKISKKSYKYEINFIWKCILIPISRCKCWKYATLRSKCIKDKIGNNVKNC